jgi:histidine ammonia-lyase
LRPKEALAIMNGTAVMTGLACLNYVRAEYLTRLTTRITALASFALDGNAEHFDETLFSVKPHPGQQAVAGWLRQDLPVQQSAANGKRLQDRYSIRCAPHVIGVLADALSWLRSYIENELNSANDNPIIDATGERVLHGGHFGSRIALHGQHEKRRGQLGRFARPANGLVGRQPLQQWPAGQSLRLGRCARGDQPWTQGVAD